MATIQELRAEAQIIHDEKQIGGNTAERIGDTFMTAADVIEQLGDESHAAVEAAQQAAASAAASQQAAAASAESAASSAASSSAAQESAATAEEQATTAQQSAASAADSAATAESAATEAATEAVNASASASSAQGSAAASAESASQAQQSASAATLTAEQANRTAENALLNANTADEKAMDALARSTEAQSAAQQAAVSAQNSEAYAQQAAGSASSAQSEAQAAGTAATQAQQQASASAQSAANAEQAAQEAVAAIDGMQEELDNKANKDGFYATLGAGTAVNLAGQETRSNASMYRASGGGEDIATGTARIEKIEGQTVAWNQLRIEKFIPDRERSYVTITNDGHYNTITRTGTEPQISETIFPSRPDIIGHKLFFKIETICAESFVGNTGIFFYSNSSYTLNYTGIRTDIITAKGNESTRRRLYINPKTEDVGKSVKISPIICIDLTLIYGAGNEPTSPEQFEADYLRWFGKPLTWENYDNGSLRNVQLSAIKTTGFNQYNPATGIVRGIATTNGYQITGAYTSLTQGEDTITPDANGFFNIAQDGDIVVVGGDSTTCVHFVHSGKKNGQYEPYEEHSVSLPINTMTGKMNGQGSSVVLFPNGMGEWDSIYHSGGKTYALVGGEFRAYQEGDVTDGTTMITDGRTTTYVKLATPLVYEVDDFTLPVRYQVNDFGTEEQVQASGVQGVAAILTCLYGVNAVDILRNLPQNYISEKSMDNFLYQLGAVTGGTWTKTWNTATGEWDFAYAANTEQETEPTNEENI